MNIVVITYIIIKIMHIQYIISKYFEFHYVTNIIYYVMELTFYLFQNS